MGCCECHNNKFDPFATKDFYSFEAFFADVKETAVGRQEQTPMPTKEQETELGKIDQRIAAVRADFEKNSPELDAAQAELEKTANCEVTNNKGWVNLRVPTKGQN